MFRAAGLPLRRFSMPWSKLDDRLHENPKIGALSDKAFRLYILSITYSSSRLTRGQISVIESKMVCRLAGATEDTVKELVELHAWDECPEGFCIHDYSVYNPDAEAISQKRAEAGRLGGIHSGVTRSKRSKNEANALANPKQSASKGTPVPVPVPVPVPESRIPNPDPNVKDSSVRAIALRPARCEPFEEFWKLYPARNGVKKGKAEALTEWLALKVNQELFTEIMAALAAQTKTHEWRKESGAYVPDAHRWLKKHRWGDEVSSNGAGPHGRTLEDMKAESIASLERLGYGD